jgi:hypothetical protein
MSNDESNSRIAASLITALAMVIVAIIGFYGIKIQTETPIYATLTAQPPKVVITQVIVTKVVVTKVVVTMNSPRFTIGVFLNSENSGTFA